MLKKILRHPLFWLMVICALGQLLYYWNAPLYVVGGDTISYTLEYDHAFRTPVYPYFAKIIALFSGREQDAWFAAITIAQRVIFFASVPLFYALVKRLAKNKTAINIATLLYGLSPALLSWNILPLTESISIVETVALLFFTVRYLQEHRKSDALLSGVVVLVMVMTRPAAIYLLAVWVLFWAAQVIIAKRHQLSKKRMAAIKSGLIGATIALGGVFAYACINWAYYGHFGISTVSYINKLLTIVDSGLYQKSDNAEIRDHIQAVSDEGMEIYNIVWRELYVKYPYDELNAFVNDVVSQNRGEYIGIMAKKALDWGAQPLADSYVPSTRVEVDSAQLAATLFPVSFGVVYIVIIGGCVWLGVRMVRAKKLDWVVLVFVMIVGGNVAVTILAAPYEPARLCVTSIPVLIAGATYVMGDARNLESSIRAKKAKR